MDQSSRVKTILFTGGLNPKTTEEALHHFISTKSSQPIISVRMPKQKGKQSRCFAFIDVKDKKTAELIIKVFQAKKHYLHGRYISIDFSNQSPEDKRKKLRMRLYMKKIPKNVTNESIERHLQAEGVKFRSAYQINGANNIPKGYGFIDFFKEEEAQKMLDTGFFLIGQKKILLEPYRPKGKAGKSKHEQTSQKGSHRERGSQKKKYKKTNTFPKNQFDNSYQSSLSNSQKGNQGPIIRGSKSKFSNKGNKPTRRESCNQPHHSFSKQNHTNRRRTWGNQSFESQGIQGGHFRRKLPSIENIVGGRQISNSINNINSDSNGKKLTYDPSTGHHLSIEYRSEQLNPSYEFDAEIRTGRGRMNSEPYFHFPGSLQIDEMIEEDRQQYWPVSETNSPLKKGRRLDKGEFENRWRSHHFYEEEEDFSIFPAMDQSQDAVDEEIMKVFDWCSVVKTVVDRSYQFNSLSRRKNNLRLNHGGRR